MAMQSYQQNLWVTMMMGIAEFILSTAEGLHPSYRNKLAFEEMQLFLHFFPFVGIGWRILFLDDGLPLFG